MQNVPDIKNQCKQVVVLNKSLPITKYLSFGVWIVVTNRPLTFTLNCQVHEPKSKILKLYHHLVLYDSIIHVVL